jgi:hypothetical protein
MQRAITRFILKKLQCHERHPSVVYVKGPIVNVKAPSLTYVTQLERPSLPVGWYMRIKKEGKRYNRAAVLAGLIAL